MSARVLVIVSGPDRPGVTVALFAALAEHAAVVVDLEQVTIREQLVLAVLCSTESAPADLERSLAALATGGLSVTVVPGDEADLPRHGNRHHITFMAEQLGADAVGALAGRITAAGANIESITRLARWPVTCIELVVAGGDAAQLRAGLAEESSHVGVDVAVQKASLYRRAKRLVVMDVDSTLVQGEVIEMLAAHAGCEADVAAITERAMRGELDFAASLRERVALLAGLDASAVDAVREQVTLTPGARTLVRTLKRLGYAIGIVSGGFTQVTDHLAADLGLDHASANTLEIVDGRLTGKLVGPIIDRAGKAEALRRFAAAEGLPVSQTVAVGDGANDLDMLAAAGLGIAFNAKPVVRAAADTAVNVPYLDSVLFVLGISREEVEAADAE
ncbi:MAG TPA: phosphoserine phosphatase SerB [Mycobacteriales bacterium]|nr:phosphoserine phosphatase SerB [Mycobacteriales bacterium]